MREGIAAGYCDAFADVEASFNFSLSTYQPKALIVWGSSYSGALFFNLPQNIPKIYPASSDFQSPPEDR